jgi:hypothetical protein
MLREPTLVTESVANDEEWARLGLFLGRWSIALIVFTGEAISVYWRAYGYQPPYFRSFRSPCRASVS